MFIPRRSELAAIAVGSGALLGGALLYTRRSRTRGQWLKGQLHVHTDQSDGSASPDQMVAAYAAQGYDFVALTDHMRVTAASARDIIVVPGAEVGIRTDNRCYPESSTGRCVVHVNALFTKAASVPTEPVATSDERYDFWRRGIERAHAMGTLVQLNHPDWYGGMTGDLLGRLSTIGARLFEVVNGQMAPRWEQDLEKAWDEALSAGHTIFATAGDDAHSVSAVGKHFIMVRATRNLAALEEALNRGDFYASTGPILSDVGVRSGALHIASRRTARFTFITNGGRVLVDTVGVAASCPLPQANDGYLRAVVTDSTGKAWVQPVRRRDRSLPFGYPGMLIVAGSAALLAGTSLWGARYLRRRRALSAPRG